MNNDKSGITSTTSLKDFGLVAALITIGFTVKETELYGQRIHFVFDDNSALQKAMHDYWSNALMVSASHYYDSTKQLKSRIYNER